MKNILWIIGGVAIGYYIATKTNILKTDPREAIPTNQPLLPSGSSQAINDYPRAYQQWPRYVNRDSKVEAKMTL